MRNYLIACIFILVGLTATAKTLPETLSNSAKISVLTCGSGPDLYSLFGHTAVRISDPQQHFDVVFNYGTFDFNTPNFYLKFARGQLDYMLSVEQFNSFLAFYKYENRSVTEQILNLNPIQAQGIYNLLRANYTPENRYYKYDFFYNNCSTKILDIIQQGLKTQLQLPENKQLKQSFRNLIDPYLVLSPWGDLGIDIGLGLPADKALTLHETAFLPDYLLQLLTKTVLVSGGPNTKPLVSKELHLFTASSASAEFSLFHPIALALLLLIITLVLSYFEWRSNKWYWGYNALLFGLISFFGLFIIFLWFLTDHNATANNLNILWLLPFLVLFIGNPKLGSTRFKYTHYIAIYYFAYALLSLGILPQNLHLVSTIFSLILGLRFLLLRHLYKTNN